MVMHPRLNVTEAERLCYSRRKLRAISALRNAGFDPTSFGLHKDYRVPGIRGRVYLVQHPQGAYAFSTLTQIHCYVAACQAWRAQPHLTWNAGRQEPPEPQQPQAFCCWPECRYDAAGMLEGQLLCRAHLLIYEQFLLASARRPRA